MLVKSTQSGTPRVQMSHFTFSDTVASCRQLAAVDGRFGALFREHVTSVQQRILQACTIEEYLAANELEWEASMRALQMLAQVHRRPLPYPLRQPILSILREEAPELLMDTGQSCPHQSVDTTEGGDDVRTYSVSWTLAPPPDGLSSTVREWLLLEPSAPRGAALLNCRLESSASPDRLTTLKPAARMSGIALLLEASDRMGPHAEGMRAALALINSLVRSASSPTLLLLSRGAQVAAPLSVAAAACGVANGGAWGFGRVARLEHAGQCTQSADVQICESGAAAAGAFAWAGAAVSGAEAEAVWGVSACHVARLRA